MSDFTHTTLRPLNKPTHRLGLALNYGIDANGVSAALERGITYFFFQQYKTTHSVPVIKAALKANREKYVIATGPSLGFFGGSVRRGCERMLKRFDTDYLDVFQLYWLGKMSAWTPGTIDALVKLKEEGKVRSIGVSIHDRPRAGRLAEDSPLDLFMIRYNAAPRRRARHLPAPREAQTLDRRVHGHCVAQAAERAKGLDRADDDGWRLLPVLSVEPERRRRADRPRLTGPARREPHRTRKGPPQ